MAQPLCSTHLPTLCPCRSCGPMCRMCRMCPMRPCRSYGPKDGNACSGSIEPWADPATKYMGDTQGFRVGSV
jgi:hypothetical protein